MPEVALTEFQISGSKVKIIFVGKDVVIVTQVVSGTVTDCEEPHRLLRRTMRVEQMRILPYLSMKLYSQFLA